MQRVKNIDYDEDDVYSDEDDYAGEEETYTPADRDNFATLTPVVRAELDEAGVAGGASDKEIQDALWHYYWDVSKSVAYLKNAKGVKGAAGVKKEAKVEKKSKFDLAAERSAKMTADTPKKSGKSGNTGLEKKTEAIKINDSDASPATTSQPKVRSKGLDVSALWAEEKSTRKESAAFVVIGHVDHGKSTLMGRLLLDTGAVSQRDIDRYKKQATEMGKASFALAWVMDTGSEERERGVTVDIAQHHFRTEAVDFTILDAPGHRDFVPNMIGGAAMADLAVLVVDANQLESGLKGQTREHILLAKAVGLKRVIVAINKLDSSIPAWSQDLFQHVSAVMLRFLHDAGFTDDDIVLVPCSGLSGENVVRPPPSTGPSAWVTKHPTLLAQLSSDIPPPPSLDVIKQPVRLQITDVFRGGITNPISIAGRLTSGNIQPGESVLIQPSGETATIRALEVNGAPRPWAVAAEICTLHLSDIDPQHLRTGDSLCASTPAASRISVVKTFTARLTVLEGQTLLPQAVDVHLARLHVPASVSVLLATLDGRGGVIKRRPRVVKAGQQARVKVDFDVVGAPLDVGQRVVVRCAGATVASGVVEGVEAAQ